METRDVKLPPIRGHGYLGDGTCGRRCSPESSEELLMDTAETITTVLQDARGGNRAAVDRLFTLLHDDLRLLAHKELRGQRPGGTLDTAALINEAYLRMVGRTSVHWSDRACFFAYASRAMRTVLVDYARRRSAAKRGGGATHLSLDDCQLAVEEQAELLLALNEALERLARLDKRLERTVDCRFFGGLSEVETAQALGVSERTVRRDWLRAKAWLYADLAEVGA